MALDNETAELNWLELVETWERMGLEVPEGAQMLFIPLDPEGEPVADSEE